MGGGEDGVVDCFGIGGERFVVAVAELGGALEDAAIDEEAFACGLDQVFGAGYGAGGAEKGEFGHREVILHGTQTGLTLDFTTECTEDTETSKDGRINRAEMGRSRSAPLRGRTLVGGGGLLLLGDDLVDLQAEAFGYAGPVSGIGFVEVLDLQLLDAARDAAHAGDDVADEARFGVGGHKAEEIARLRVVIGVEAVIVAVDRAGDFLRALAVLRRFFRPAEAVGFVVGLRAVIAVEAHGAIAIVGVHGALGLVDGQAVVVDAEAVAVRVGIGNQARLQHFVGREAHARDDVARFERGLLDFREIVFGIAVEHEFANFDERIVFVRPDLG